MARQVMPPEALTGADTRSSLRRSSRVLLPTMDVRSFLVARGLGVALVLPFAVACSSDDATGKTTPGPEHQTDAAAPDSGAAAALTDGVLAVWGATPDDAWAIGVNGAMAHYDGSNWTLTERVTDKNLLALCGPSATDIWATGDDVVLHYDGTTWSVALADMFETLPGVACRGPDDIWMTGIATDANSGVIRHWNGAKFEVLVVGSARSFWDVWISDSGVIWTGGSSIDGAGFLVRGDTVDGQTAFDLVEDYAGQSLREIWGSKDDDMWISPYEGPFEHWDGAAFGHDFGESPETVLGLGGGSTDDAWAVGLAGTILHFDGSTWTPSDSGIDTNLTSIWEAAPDDVWVAGSKGVILHNTGSGWSRSKVLPAP